MVERRARYLKHFGPDWWWFDVPGWRVLGINAQLLGSDLAEAAEQDDSDRRRRCRGIGLRSLALFLHKPLFDQTADESTITGRFLNPGSAGDCWRGSASRRSWSSRPRPSVPLHDGRRLAPCLGAVDGFCVPDASSRSTASRRSATSSTRFKPDGTHDSRMVEVPGASTLNIEILPAALLAAPKPTPAPAGRAGCRASCARRACSSGGSFDGSSDRSAPTAMPLCTAGPRAELLEPALEVLELLDVLALDLPVHRPRIADHVGDRVLVAGQILVLSYSRLLSTPYSRFTSSVKRRDGVGLVALGVAQPAEVAALAALGPLVGHLPDQPLGDLVLGAQVLRVEFPVLLGEVHHDRAGFEDADRLAAAGWVRDRP